jgi:hypothetical protein
MSMAAMYDLRRALERRFPDALPPGRSSAVAGTGIAALDALLPGGGLPRGRLTAWTAGGGAVAVLRAACEAAVCRGERAVWIDAARVQSADFWRAGPLLLRPSGELPALEAAEALLRSGGLALLVLHGGGREAAAREAVRLARAARAGGAALVMVGAAVPVARLRVASQLSPDAYRWRYNVFGEPAEPVAVRLEVTASAQGWSGRTRFELPVRSHHPRLCPEPHLPDRRGAAPAARWRPPPARRRPPRALAPSTS